MSYYVTKFEGFVIFYIRKELPSVLKLSDLILAKLFEKWILIVFEYWVGATFPQFIPLIFPRFVIPVLVRCIVWFVLAAKGIEPGVPHFILPRIGLIIIILNGMHLHIQLILLIIEYVRNSITLAHLLVHFVIPRILDVHAGAEETLSFVKGPILLWFLW